MAISGMLNTTITIKRMAVDPGGAGNTNDLGEVIQAWTTIATTTKARIESISGSSEMMINGRQIIATHMGYVKPSADVEENDEITDNTSGYKYRVNLVEDNPGGSRTHHQELYLESVNYK